MVIVVKNPPANAGDVRDSGSIPGLGRSPGGGGHGNPLQCSCLGNPTDRGAWWPAVHVVTKSQTRLKRLSSSSSSGKEPARQFRRHKRCGFDPWVGNIRWRRRTWQPTPVFLPGESHGQRSLAGYSPQGCTELDTTEMT